MPRKQAVLRPEPSALALRLLKQLADEDFWADLDNDMRLAFGMAAFVIHGYGVQEAASVLSDQYDDVDLTRAHLGIRNMASAILATIKSGDY